jgi:hypothetical protein
MFRLNKTGSLILILFSQNIRDSVEDDNDNEEVQKCLIDIAEISPKFLKAGLDQVTELCLGILGNADVSQSRKHLALEVLVTLAENASGMVRKNCDKYMPILSLFFFLFDFRNFRWGFEVYLIIILT